MRDLSPEDVYRYACEDADVTLKLKNVLETELKEQGAEHMFYEIEMPLVHVLVNIESKMCIRDSNADAVVLLHDDLLATGGTMEAARCVYETGTSLLLSYR